MHMALIKEQYNFGYAMFYLSWIIMFDKDHVYRSDTGITLRIGEKKNSRMPL